MVREDTVRTFDRWATEGRGARMEEGHALTGVPAVDGLRVPVGGRVLDLGCGNAWAARRVLASVPRVLAVAVDASGRMVRAARDATPAAARASFARAAFEALPFREAAFDAAFSMEALYYASDLDQALAELARVLETGAHARLVIDYYAENPASHDWPGLVGVPMHLRAEAEWRASCLAAGFEAAETSRLRAPAESARAHKQPWTASAGSLLVDLTR